MVDRCHVQEKEQDDTIEDATAKKDFDDAPSPPYIEDIMFEGLEWWPAMFLRDVKYKSNLDEPMRRRPVLLFPVLTQ